MEGQKVLVARGGIVTSLNARTTVLAAANPVGGLYDVDKTEVENMNLPAAMLSRFDLKFLILDDPDLVRDLEKAKFVLGNMHHDGKDDDDGENDMEDDGKGDQVEDIEFLRAYIEKAQEHEPVIEGVVAKEIIETWVEMRKDAASNPGAEAATLRQLHAMARLAKAFAKFEFIFLL